MRQKDIRPAPAKIEFKGMKFLITDRPSDVTIHSYIAVSMVFIIFGKNALLLCRMLKCNMCRYYMIKILYNVCMLSFESTSYCESNIISTLPLFQNGLK